MRTSIPVLSAAQLATAYALRPHLFGWFLGAGASAASGIPTGYAMIRDFKARIFSQRTRISLKEIDSTDSQWAARIDAYFRQNSILPPEDDPCEYAAAFEEIYPTEKLRRQYIEDAVLRGTPSYAHRVLAAFIADRKVPCVFTTNFDPLVEQSVTVANELLATPNRVSVTVAALDSYARAQRCMSESAWPLIAKVHGDFTSIQLKNTNDELKYQDENMRSVLVDACTRFGLIVVGYSGRDTSVMDALRAVLKDPRPYPNGLYWVAQSRDRLLPAVHQLLEEAQIAGVEVAIVESKTFDELAGDFFSQVHLPTKLEAHVKSFSSPARLQPVELSNAEAKTFPVLRFSTLLLETIPTHARRVVLNSEMTTPKARELLKESGCRATVAALGRELAVFGKDAEILNALKSFGAKAEGTILLQPEIDSWARGLIYDALTKALSQWRPLQPRFKRNGHALVVATPRPDEDAARTKRREEELSSLKDAYGGALSGIVLPFKYPFREGVQLRLESVENRWWCSFEPLTFVDIPMESGPPQGTQPTDELGRQSSYRGDPTGDWRRERWARKYNREWSRIIDAWTHMLTSTPNGKLAAFEIDEGDGVDAVFSLSPLNGWSRPAHHHSYFDRTQ